MCVDVDVHQVGSGKQLGWGSVRSEGESDLVRGQLDSRVKAIGVGCRQSGSRAKAIGVGCRQLGSRANPI